MPTALQELGGRLDQKRAEIAELFDKKDGAGQFDWTSEDVDRYRSLEVEAKDLQGKYDRQRELEDAERKNREARDDLHRVRPSVPYGDGSALMGDLLARLGGSPESGHDSAAEALAKAVVEHADFKDFRPNRPVSLKLVDFDFGRVATERKAVLSNTAGFPPPALRSGVVVPYALRRPVVADLIPQDPTNAPSIVYMEQTTNTNNAAPVAEGGSKPEGAFLWVQRSQSLEVVAETLPITEQQLDDVPQIEQLIRGELTTHLLLAEEDQLLNGTGTSPQLQGFLTKAGVQTRLAGTEPTADVLLRAMTDVAVTGRAAANGIIMHPLNYLTMRLVTANGIYIFGPPSQDVDVTVWGMTPVVTDAIVAGTALVGDFRTYSHISRRRGIQIDVGFVNDDFRRNQRTVRGEFRESLEIKRASAFVKITGLA